jgi:hypothetical protein
VELLYLELDLFETLLNDVADADDPMKCFILNDGQMPDPLQCHHLHDIDEPVLGPASSNLTGHESLGRKCQQGVGMF